MNATKYRITMTTGARPDGMTGSKFALIATARAFGLCVAKAWDDGSVPLYRDAHESRKDKYDGSSAIGLIRAVHNDETA